MRSFTRTANRAQGGRRAEVTLQLLEAVERLLAAGHAYAELSVERLATEAGLSRSSYYRYFADKGELLQALADDVVSSLNDTGRQVWDLGPDTGKAELGEALSKLLREAREHRMVYGAIMEAQGYDAEIRRHHEAIMDDAVGYVAEHIERGQRDGWVRGGVEPVATAQWLCWMTERGIGAVVGPAPQERVPALTESLTEIVWRTLYDDVREP